MNQLIDRVFRDRYRIETLLGRKTGRRTFLARDLQTHEPIVIKLLLFGPDFTWDDLKLFEREAETLKELDYPFIPQYLDSFEVETELGKGFALVQSYIEARSLHDWMQSGRNFSESELRTLARELLEILDYLHARKPPVIHRDIKPSNILLGDRSGNSPGQVYLIDFGSVQTAIDSGTITVVGTYGYMPPEQFGGRTTAASDLYSVGATLIYLLTRTHPANLPMRKGRIQFEEERLVSPQFQTWLKFLIQPDLDQRFKTARSALDALQQDLLTLQSSQEIRSKPEGSRVVLTKTDDRLQIAIPPLRFGQKIEVINSSLILTILCCTLFLLGLWKPEALFLVAPLVLWAVSLIWTSTFGKIFKKIQLSIDRKVICLTHSWLGFKKRFSSPTQDIIKLERINYRDYSLDINQYPIPSGFWYSGLKIWVGNQCYLLGGAKTSEEIPRLTEVELDWLAVELSDWLDLPIQTSGERTTVDRQSDKSADEMNAESHSIDSVSENALSSSSSTFPRISRPGNNAKCTVNKSPEMIEISAPAGVDFAWTAVGCITFIVSFLFLIGGSMINPAVALFWGAVPMVLFVTDNSINQRQKDVQIILRIDRDNISLWKRSQSEQNLLSQADRSTIHKLQLVYKANKNYEQSCHVKISISPFKISISHSNNTLKDRFLIGNRQFWLSRWEAEWLARELSLWLNLPVTEVEVVENVM